MNHHTTLTQNTTLHTRKLYIYLVLELGMGMVGRSIRKQELDGVYHEYG